MKLLADGGNRVAIACGNSEITYAQLAAGAADKCRALRHAAAGIRRLALDLPDSVSLLEWVIAAWQLDCSITILDPRLTDMDKEERLQRFAPHARIAAAEGPVNRMLAFQFDVSWHLQLCAASANKEAAPTSEHGTSDEAIMLFSSGSTGMPKGIVRSFAALEAEWMQYSLEPGSPHASSVIYCLVPVSHSFGLLSAALFTLRQGGTVLFPPALQPRDLISAWQTWPVTHVYGVAFHYQLLAQGLDQLDPQARQLLLRQRPHLLSSGGSLPQSLLAQYRERYDLPIGQQYGMSEVGYISVDFHGKAPGSVGMPASHLKGERREGDGQWAIRLEMCPYVGRQENWIADQGTAGGWLLTEDLVHIDEHGHLYVTGRTNDVVSIGGLKVRLQEIEQAALRHAHIAACCAIAQQHPALGQVLHLFVVWNEQGSVRSSALQQWLRSSLSDYKIPKHIHSVERIPRSAAGKIIRSELLKECSYGSSSA